MGTSLRIIVTGLIAQHPVLGGVTWDYLQYVVGLARLGHDVYYFEDSGQWPYNLSGGESGDEWIARNADHNVRYLARVMARYDLGDRWAYRFPTKRTWHGLPSSTRREVIASADLLLNVSGTLRRPSDYRQVHRLAYIDSDPVFTQVKLNLPRGHLKFQKRVAAHDVFFSFGECFSDRVPGTSYQWRRTRSPIVLSEWQQSSAYRDVLTTVMSWTSYPPLTQARRSYGQKDVEFQRFLLVPRRVGGVRLEIALGATEHLNWQRSAGAVPADVGEFLRKRRALPPRRVIRQAGWHTVNAFSACNGLDRYRRYVQSSKAEWSIAKNGYVVGQAGWFSCRSACYLASGRPVIVQDTGFGEVIPTGEGVLTFQTPDEAVAAIEEVQGNYDRHALAAREIAGDYFDSAKVLPRLVEDAMSNGLQIREGALR